MKIKLFTALFLSLLMASGCGDSSGVATQAIEASSESVTDATESTDADSVGDDVTGEVTGDVGGSLPPPSVTSSADVGGESNNTVEDDAAADGIAAGENNTDVSGTDSTDAGATGSDASDPMDSSTDASGATDVNDPADANNTGSGNTESAGGSDATDAGAVAGGGADEPDVSDEEVEGLSASDELVPSGNVQSPPELRAVRYSASAGELFWGVPSDADGSTRFVILRDGELQETVSTMSYFTNSLSASIAHKFSVYAIDTQGGVSQAAQISINDQVDIPPPVYEFDLAVDQDRAALVEGSSEGVRFQLRVEPQGLEDVEIAVRPQDPAEGENVSVTLAKQTLNHEDRQTSVLFRFPVGMRPIAEQSRRFNVIATSGEIVRIAEIILDVKPIDAPDIYLLIGQSNMVGSSLRGAKDVSPGGADERNPRIRQLNVLPNNRSLFSQFEDFLDEDNTAIQPSYIEAEDPLHDPRGSVVKFKGGTTVGPGLSFAKAALADTTKKIYLVPAAWGASGFCNSASDNLAWNAELTNNASLGGTGLLERALTRLSVTMRDTGGILRGILWHQGGADSNQQACADTHEENLRRMVERIRAEAPVDARGKAARGARAPVPFIVATQSKGNDERGDYSLWPATKSKVDAVHRNIAGIVPYADWVNNDDLVPPAYPCGSSSCVHFGAEANREIGHRYYDALQRIWSR